MFFFFFFVIFFFSKNQNYYSISFMGTKVVGFAILDIFMDSKVPEYVMFSYYSSIKKRYHVHRYWISCIYVDHENY